MTLSPPLAGSSADGASDPARSGVVSTQRLGGCVIVRLDGDVDGALSLGRALRDLVASDDLVVDLSRLGALAETTMEALAAAYDEAALHGTTVHLTGADGSVLALLQGPELGARLAYHEELADAVEAALTARDARLSA